MAEPFDGTSPGSETRRYGDYIDPVAGEDLYGGEVVALDASGEAVLAGDGDKVVGVVYVTTESGDRVTVKTRGTVVAKVSANVAVGSPAGGIDSSVTTPDADAAPGELATDGDEYYVLDAGTKTDPRSGVDADYAEVDKF